MDLHSDRTSTHREVHGEQGISIGGRHEDLTYDDTQLRQRSAISDAERAHQVRREGLHVLL
jgi:hypothetical protein